MYQLCRHPDKQEKLFRELRTLLPRDDVRLDAAVIDKMAYLKACVKETLRCEGVDLRGRPMSSFFLIY